jgi:hypothetical protein
MTTASDSLTELRFHGQYTDSDVDALARFTVGQLLDQRIGKATMSASAILAVGAVLLRSWPVAIGGFILVLGFSALVRYVILPGRLVGHAKQLPGLSGDRVIAVEGGAVRHDWDGQSQTFPLDTVRRLVLHKAHLFILLKPRGCLMLPLAWIQAPATIDRVVQTLVRRKDG